MRDELLWQQRERFVAMLRSKPFQYGTPHRLRSIGKGPEFERRLIKKWTAQRRRLSRTIRELEATSPAEPAV
jgi:hypothetical protein